MTAEIHTQIVGLGSATVGLFITADRIGVFDDFMKLGIVIHERASNAHDWNSLAYHINSNSPVSDFFVGIRPDGIFAAEYDTFVASGCLVAGDDSINLIEMSQFFKSLMLRIVALIEASGTCDILWGNAVDEVRMTANGSFLISGKNGYDALVSQSLVLATGASNRVINQDFRAIGEVIACDYLLRGQMDEQVECALNDDRKVIILGGSHSGFSGLGYILHRFGAMISHGQMHLVSRGVIRNMYDKTEAKDFVLTHRDTINPMTGEINRFTGLRGDARKMHHAVAGGKETRVTLHQLQNKYDADDLYDCCALAPEARALLINATGYRPRIPALFDSDGQEVDIDLSCGNARKCSVSGELYSRNRKITKLFGTGLGFADAGPDGPQVGINFFNSSTSQRIVESILN